MEERTMEQNTLETNERERDDAGVKRRIKKKGSMRGGGQGIKRVLAVGPAGVVLL